MFRSSRGLATMLQKTLFATVSRFLPGGPLILSHTRYGSVNSKPAHTPPPEICHPFVFFLNLANAPRRGQPIRTNPHGSASNA